MKNSICKDCSAWKEHCSRFTDQPEHPVLMCRGYATRKDYDAKKADFCKSCAFETAAKALAEQVKTLKARIAQLEKEKNR